MDTENDKWKVSSFEFQGYMKASIEEIKKKLDKFDMLNITQDNRLGKVENRLTATEVKGGIFGFLGGFIGGFIAWFTGFK